MARIVGVQRCLAENRTRKHIILEAKLRKELDEVLHQEELLWYQKSRVDWIRDGDRNTTFFHLSTIARRWRNKINAIKNNAGVWVTDKNEVKASIVSFFSSLFTEEHIEDNDGNNDLPRDIFPEFSLPDWEALMRPYSRTEIETVVKNMGALKAPGPDGFQALFFQKNWDMVSDNVYQLASNVLEGKGMSKRLNDTHIVLIPKVENPEFANQFRSISLCNVAYKIVTKTIVNRIKPMMPHLTACTQSSFVPGRQITDNIVIVQEVIHTMRNKQGSKGFMAIKIDFEKAYDRLRWSFIQDTLLEI